MPSNERKTNDRADVTRWVKLAYLFVGIASVAYFLVHMHGGGSVASAADVASSGLLYGATALAVVFGVGVVGSALRHPVPQKAISVPHERVL